MLVCIACLYNNYYLSEFIIVEVQHVPGIEFNYIFKSTIKFIYLNILSL